MNLSVLIKELDELEKRYQEWVKPINKKDTPYVPTL
jgi:hypothetical protein